jgi:hypothetical protein
MTLERRIAAREERQAPEPTEERPAAHSNEEVAAWWADRYNYARAAQLMGITGEEARERWPGDCPEMWGRIEELNAQAQALCEEQEAGPEEP